MFAALARGVPRLVFLVSLSHSAVLQAAGLEYPWQSTAAMGTAQANAAEAADASTVFFNPAGMVRLRSTTVSQAGQVLSVRGRFVNDGTTKYENGELVPVTGGSAGSYHPQAIPAGQFYVVTPYDDRITLGFGLFVPYGANVNYKSDWVGRFFKDAGAIESINLNPSLAIRFDDKHSLGLGLSAQIMHVRLRAGVDVQEGANGIARRTIQSGASQLCSPSGLPLVGGISAAVCSEVADLLAGPLVSDGAGEGKLLFDGLGIGHGWNIGYMYRFNDDRTRVGLTYRSAIRMRVSGDVDWDFRDVSGNIPDITGVREGDPVSLAGAMASPQISLQDYTRRYVRPDSDGRIRFTTPDSVGMALFHQVDADWAVMGSATWTRSSSIQALRLEIADRQGPNGTVRQGDGVVNTRFRDTWKIAAGANYRWDERLLLRGGIGFEQTPVPDPESRDATTPDADRVVLSLGANLLLRKNLSMDLAYSHIRLKDAKANYTDDCHPSGYIPSKDDGVGATDGGECTGNGGTFRGEFKDTYVNSLGIQINQRF